MKTILGVIRLPFLILGPVCVFLGMAVAIHEVGSVYPWHVALCFIGAVFAHISVNALNEYDDYKSGLDLVTDPTELSGGSGEMRKDPKKVVYALLIGLFSAIIVMVIGIFFFSVKGWPIAVIGLIGLAIIASYTPILNRYPFLCLIAPGIGFGTLMVLGTHFVLTSKFGLPVILASFIPFFLVSNLLLLNQFPDVEADKTVGRRHFPILIGKKASAGIFAGFFAAVYLLIILCVILKIFPIWCLLGLITLIPVIPAVRGAVLYNSDVRKLKPSMWMNVLINILTPVLVGIGFLIG